MYTFSNKISQVINNYEPVEDGLILIRGTHETCFLEYLNDEDKLLVKIEQDTAYDFVNFGSNLLFTNKEASKTYAYNKTNQSLNLLPYILHLKGHRDSDKYFCYTEIDGKNCFTIISLDSFMVVDNFPVEISFGVIDSFFGTGIVSSKKRNGIVGLIKFPNEIVWQLNVPHLLNNDINLKAPISFIEVDKLKNRAYIICLESILCLTLDGKILWITDIKFKSSQIHIRNNEGYIITSDNFVKLDLETGKINISKKIGHISFQSKKLSFQGHSPQIFDGLLWCTLQTSGYSFIAALEPESGNLEWLQNVPTSNFINAPRFYRNKMYVLDTGGDLFIYKK